MYILKTAFIASFTFASCLVNAGKIEIRTTPAGDGMLVDSNNDGIADKVSSSVLDSKGAMEANSGHIWKQSCKAIFEFKLPKDKVGDVKKATLVLNVNGKHGTHPDKAGAGPECDIWYYTGKNANGAVELTDEAGGNKLGTAVKQGHKAPGNRKIKIDVTAAVKDAIGQKAVFVGFRIQKSATKGPDGAWRWRTSEFGQKYGKQITPTLIIISK